MDTPDLSEIMAARERLGKDVTPEQMAKELQVTMDQLAEVFQTQLKMFNEQMAVIQRLLTPPRPNRAQRRAKQFGHEPGRFQPGTKT